MLSEILLLAAAACTQASPTSTPKAPLEFTDDGSFHISVFNDLHFGEHGQGQGPLWDIHTVTIMENVVDTEKPQLVVLNGDLISGDQVQTVERVDYVDQIVKPLEARKLPWAATYGNHDSQYHMSRERLYEREKTFQGSYTERMVTGENAGITNYYLPVYTKDCNASLPNHECVPELLLWFFDSRSGKLFHSNSPQPDWVDTEVVKWFNKTSTELNQNYGKAVPSLAFVHIPINATVAFQKAIAEDEKESRRHPGSNDETYVAQQGTQWKANGQPGKSSDYGGQDEPFMEALVSTPGLLALFYGHDHGLTWCYQWKGRVGGMKTESKGLHLCFGQHAGYGGYGHWVRGSRQIHVTREMLKKMELDTHTRLETGEIVGAVTLNRTFNEDVYEAVPNLMSYMNLDGKRTIRGRSSAAGVKGSLTALTSVILITTYTVFFG